MPSDKNSPPEMSGATDRDAAVTADLLARFGLPADADADTVESTHAAIGEYLAQAPDELRGWAKRRQREADRIYALLTGPAEDRAALAPTRDTAKSGRWSIPKPFLAVGALVVVIAVVVGVYFLGRPAGANIPGMTAADNPTATAAAIDQAKVAELMAKIQANPNDIDSLAALGDIYLSAQDYPNAKTFISKILQIDPTNENAMINLGLICYNTKDLTGAEDVWKRAEARYPNNPSVHYYLGFLYMTTNRNTDMQAEWAKVVELAPGSALANTVQSHVGSVKTPGASASPGVTASPGASASPVAGPTPTPTSTRS